MKISRLFVAISIVLCVCLGVLSCKKEAPEDAAAQMALTCYQHLIAEEYDTNLQALVNYEHMPASYREELKALLAQYVRKEITERGGFSSVTVNSDTIIGTRANVFLQLKFKDGSTEEISVPMIYDNNVWKLQ